MAAAAVVAVAVGTTAAAVGAAPTAAGSTDRRALAGTGRGRGIDGGSGGRPLTARSPVLSCPRLGVQRRVRTTRVRSRKNPAKLAPPQKSRGGETVNAADLKASHACGLGRPAGPRVRPPARFFHSSLDSGEP